MKILIASLGIPGHLNPLLAAGTLLASQHEVVVQTVDELRPLVEASGLSFLPEAPGYSTSLGSLVAAHPEYLTMPPGPESLGFALENLLAAALPKQVFNLQQAMNAFAADLILSDSFYFGTLPLLLGPRDKRPAIAHLGISVLNVHGGKNVPRRPGLSEQAFSEERAHFQRVVVDRAQAAFNRTLGELGLGPLTIPVMESPALLSDLYIQPGIRSFEYPTDGDRVHYIGRLPMPAGQAGLPAWWQDLDPSKRLVLVTQGTVANHDLGQLIGPTLRGLADEDDVIVLVTTGGKPIEDIEVEIPANARIAPFLPYDKILPSIDLLITNGGYGTVNMALAEGIPIVSAGLTEDKEEVSAHVEWAGVGINLNTQQPTPDAVRRAAREALDAPGYRAKASKLAAEFASSDAKASLLSLVASLVK